MKIHDCWGQILHFNRINGSQKIVAEWKINDLEQCRKMLLGHTTKRSYTHKYLAMGSF